MRNKWGSRKRLCQESNTTWTVALIQTVGRLLAAAAEREQGSNKLFSRGNSLSQQPEGLSPRLGTFGTFGLEGRGPRHHLLSVLWEHAWLGGETFFSHLSEQPLPALVLVSTAWHPQLGIWVLYPRPEVLIQETDTGKKV